MSTVKVYEIADDLKMETETVLQKIRSLGHDVKNKMSKIDVAYVDQIKSSLVKEKQASYVEVEVAPGVIKRKPIKLPDPPPPPPKPARTVDVRPAVVPLPPMPPVVQLPPVQPPVVAAAPKPEVVEAPVEPREERVAPEPVVTPPVVAAPVAPAPVVTAPVVTAPVVTAPTPEPQPEPARVERPEPVVEAPKAPPVVVAAPEPAPVVVAAPEPVVVASAEPVRVPETPVREPERVEAPAPRTEVVAPVHAETPKAVETPVVAAVTREPEVVEAPRAVPQPEPVVATRSDAPPAPMPSQPPRANERAAADAAPAGANLPKPRPLVPPTAPKTGISVWNPTTGKVEHIPTSETRAGGRPSMPPSAGAGGAAGARPANNPMNTRRVIMAAPTQSRPNARPTNNRPGTGGTNTGPRRPAMATVASANAKARPPAAEMAKHKRVIKIEEQISLQELARRMSLKATDVLMKLLQIGGMGKNINSTLDSDTAKLLANEFQYDVEDVALDLDAIIKAALPVEKPGEMIPRAPVVTVMGHVDHGKTTLLDAILGMRVAEGELGGITQEVRAYRVITPKGPVVFFDTPGHEAFTSLRLRGAQTTDVAVLVVAADDGVMPTTIEAINHARAAKVPIVVALNKMDRPDANPDRVIQQLMQYGIVPENFGGDEMVVNISAKTRMGVEELLEKLALQTDILELKANPKKAGIGTVFESKLDKGRGAVARVLVQEGTIRAGDVVLAGTAYGRIRAMFDDRGKTLDKAGPSVPVEVLGLNEVPVAGDKMYVVQDMRKAQEVAEKLKGIRAKAPVGGDKPSLLDKVLAAQSANQQLTVSIVIKADAQGAVEGLKKALTSLSTEKVKVEVLHAAVGAITESDIQLAAPSHAVVIGFNVRPAGKAAAVAEEHKIDLKFYGVIYEAVDDIKALMVGQLKPTLLEKPLGKAEVRQVFNITKIGTIAGCMVLDGSVKRGARCRLVRDGAVKWEGKIASLRRIKDDVKEVGNGFECGIGLENFADIKSGDLVEAYEIEEVAAQL